MRPRTVLVLLTLGLVALGGGWWATQERAPAVVDSAGAGLAFPGLAAKLQDAGKIEIAQHDKTLEIVRHGDVWGVAARDSYPVQVGKLRELLTGLTELRLTEKRTVDPTQFGKLGVDDPSQQGSTANLIRVFDRNGTVIAALVAGHRRMRAQGGGPEEIYVRRPAEQQSWLAEGRLVVDADPGSWLDRDIMNIDPNRIAGLEVTDGESRLVLKREGDKLAMAEPAEHPPLDEFKLDQAARALESLTLQDVRKAGPLDAGKAARAVFTTSDGLTVDASVVRSGSDAWARFAASGAGDAAKEAAALAAKLDGWEYQVGSFKAKSLAPGLDDLKAAESAPPPRP